MTQSLYWLHWVGAFLIVLGLLVILAGVQNENDRRKERK